MFNKKFYTEKSKYRKAVTRKILCSIFVGLLAIPSFSQEFSRKEYNFNSDWKLKTGDFSGAEKPGFNDRSWKEVTLPYAYNQEEAFEKSIFC